MKKLAMLAVSAGLLASAARGQTLIPMTPGQALKGQALASLGQLAQGILAMANGNRELDVEVVTARREFFGAANSTPTPALSKRFAEALRKRDLHYVVYDITRDRRASPLLKLSFDLAGTGTVDGGVSPYCSATFRAWSNQLVSQLSALGALDPALKAAMPEFEKYTVERDLAEALFFNPHGVLRATNPNNQEYLAAWILGTKIEPTVSSANASAARIAALLGGARLTQVTDVLRDWTAVTASLEGPWGEGAAKWVLDPLVSGKPLEPTPADWTAQTRVFSELRGRLADPRIKLARSLIEVQRLWDSGRQSRNIATLQQAAARRDALVQEIEDASMRNLEFRYSDNGLTKSMTSLNLEFIDRAIGATEVDMMRRGDKNPRGDLAAGETRNYLAWNARLIPRSVQAPPPRPERVAVVVSAPATQPDAPSSDSGAAPVLPDPNAEGVGPFDRAIILVLESGAVHISPTYLSNQLHIHAKNWDLLLDEPNPTTRELALGRVIEETRLLVRDLRQNVENRKTSFNMSAANTSNPQRRQALETQIAPLIALADELEARIPDMTTRMKQSPQPGAGR